MLDAIRGGFGGALSFSSDESAAGGAFSFDSIRPRTGMNSVSWLNLKLLLTSRSTKRCQKICRKRRSRLAVNGEGRDAEQRSVYLDELGLELAVLLSCDDTTSQREVSVEPCVPDSTTIGLHSDL